MALVRPVGYGLLVFPVVVGSTLATSPTTVLLAGFPVGFVVGYASDGWVAGLRNGFVAGYTIATLFLIAGYYVVTAPDYLPPGVGITLLFTVLAAIALGVESTVAAGFGGRMSR